MRVVSCCIRVRGSKELERNQTMTDTVMSTKAFRETLLDRIPTEKVRVQEDNGVIHITPVKEKKKYEIELRGILADCPEMTVDKFLERKHADKELEG